MYLIIGANGFLGTYLLKNILERTDEKILATSRNIECVTRHERIDWTVCELADRDSVDALAEKATDKEEALNVICLAAYHHPDLVEINPKLAWNVNVTSLAYLVNRLEHVRCFFYPSTEFVYGESVDGYRFKEEDAPHPFDTYGVLKMVAEDVVRGYGYNVVRYPFLIGPSLSPVKKHFYDHIEKNLREGKPVEMFCNMHKTPLSFDTAAGLLVEVIKHYRKSICKTLNLCGDEILSKYEIGLRIADKLGADRNLIVPVKMEDDRKIFKTPRVKATLLDNSRIKETLGLPAVKFEI